MIQYGTEALGNRGSYHHIIAGESVASGAHKPSGGRTLQSSNSLSKAAVYLANGALPSKYNQKINRVFN